MKNNWKIYALTFICFITNVSEFAVVGVLDKIAASTNLSISAAGQLITVYAIAGAIGTPIVVMALAKMDRRLVLMLSLVLTALGGFMTLVSFNYALLLLARIVLAIGAEVFCVTGLTVVAALAAPGRQVGAIATFMTGFNAALIFGLPMGRVLTNAFGWKFIFGATGILSIIAILIIASMIPSQKGQEAMPVSKQLVFLKNPRILLTFGITFFWITGYAVLYSYITPFLLAVSPMSERMLSLVLFVFGLATLAGNKLGGFMGDHLGVKRSLTSSMIAHTIILVLLSTIAGPIIITIPLLVLWAVAAWTPASIQQCNIIALAPDASAIMLSLNSSILQLAFAAGAAIGGITMKIATISILSWIGAIFVAAAIYIIWASFRRSAGLVKELQEQ